MHALLHLAILTVTVWLLARRLPGVHINRPATAVVVAVVFAVLNVALGWLIRLALVVPGILTLGLLFLFVPLIVNTIVLWLTDKLLGGFELKDARTLWVASAIITAVGWLTHVALRF